VVQLSALLHDMVDSKFHDRHALNKGLLVNFEWKQAMRHNSMVIKIIENIFAQKVEFWFSSIELSFRCRPFRCNEGWLELQECSMMDLKTEQFTTQQFKFKMSEEYKKEYFQQLIIL
jgi:hypothetical protein